MAVKKCRKGISKIYLPVYQVCIKSQEIHSSVGFYSRKNKEVHSIFSLLTRDVDGDLTLKISMQ